MTEPTEQDLDAWEMERQNAAEYIRKFPEFAARVLKEIKPLNGENHGHNA